MWTSIEEMQVQFVVVETYSESIIFKALLVQALSSSVLRVDNLKNGPERFQVENLPQTMIDSCRPQICGKLEARGI